MGDERQSPAIPRDLLEKYFKDDPRLISHFEDQSIAVEEAVDVSGGTVQATDALQNATVVTLSPNAVFNNEFVLTNGDGTALTITEGNVSIRVDSTVARTEGGAAKFTAPGNVTLGLPESGTLISDTIPATLFRPSMAGLVNATDNADAATKGVPLNAMYRDGTTLKIRVT